MNDKKVLKSFVMVTQIGISMMVPIFLCGLIGNWLNHLFHREWIFLVMLFIGIGAAFRNFFMVTKSFYAKDMAEEHKKLQYINELKTYHENHPEEVFSDADVMEGKKKRYPELKGETRH